MNGAITGLYAALTALLVVGLGARVALLRIRNRVGLGDGGIVELQRAIRVHGNLIEYAPLALLLLLICELSGAAPPRLLHLAGGAIVVGRVLHALAVSRSSTRSPGRFAGMALTWGTLLGLASLLLLRAAG